MTAKTNTKQRNSVEPILNWNKQLGKPFNDRYLEMLNNFINLGSEKGAFHHKIFDIFKAFEYCDAKSAKVVIMSDTYNIGTGLPYGSMLSETGKVDNKYITYIENAIERDLKEGFNLNFDPSLESWAMQNVLMLNTSYTFAPGLNSKYLKIWQKFNIKLIRALSDYNHGMHFVFLGGKSVFFNSLVNKAKHWTYTEGKPEVKKEALSVDFMKRINDRLCASNGKETQIQWHKYI